MAVIKRAKATELALVYALHQGKQTEYLLWGVLIFNRPTGKRIKWIKIMENNTTKYFISPDEISRLQSGRMDVPAFSDISDGNDFGAIPGRKIRVNEILGREIIVTGFQLAPSRKKQDSDYLTIQFMMNGQLYIIWTGSVVLRRILEKYSARLPFKTTIVRAGEALVFG